MAALRNSLTAFQQAVDGIPGGKNLIWLTASIPFTYGTGAERRKDDQTELDRMERLMSEANVTVYAVDPRGAGAGNKLSAGGILGCRDVGDSSADTLAGTQGMQVIWGTRRDLFPAGAPADRGGLHRRSPEPGC